MACRYTYEGKTYSASEFMRVLSDLPPATASAFMPSVQSIPNAPFVNNTDDWAMLAFKRMVRVAAEGGFDRIAWITGDQQAERYDLSKQIDSVTYDPLNKRLVATKDRQRVLDETVPPEKLDDYIGKDVASKLLSDDTLNGAGNHVLSGLDLRTGGEGMRGFYDKILPSAVGKWAKKMGGKVGTTVINPITKITGGGLSMREIDLPAHSLDLTDAMREVALAGMPLFSRPDTEFVVNDSRGKELGRAGTRMEADRLASRLRNTGKRIGDILPVARAAAWLDGQVRAPASPIPARFDAEQAMAAEKVATFRPGEGLATRVERIKDQFGKRFVQKAFDQFRPLKDLDPTAFMQAHLSKASQGTLEAVFEYGMPVVKQGAYDIAENTGGFRKELTDLNGEHDEAMLWVAANRAHALANEITVSVDGKDVKRFTDMDAAEAFAAEQRANVTAGNPLPDVQIKAESRERLFEDQDIAALRRLNQGTMKDGRDRATVYRNFAAALNRYNKALLDIGEKAGVIDPESRAVWESEFYVPFYRTMADDAQQSGPGQMKGLLRNKVIERLKGGREPLGDLLENTLSNWEHMLGSSMRNMAATKAIDAALELGAAEKVSAKAKGSVWIMRDGKQEHYLIHDAPVLEALDSLSFNGYNNPLMRAAGKFKRMLTATVTISPSFRIRNLIRDTLSAVATSDVSYNPVRNVIDGFKVQKADAAGISLLAGGGAIRFGVITDGDNAKHAKRLLELGIKDKDILDTREKFTNVLRKAYDWWQLVGDKVETVNRAAIYDRAIKARKSHLEASFEARDLMNFTSMGSASAIRALSQVLPFFNARLQGADRLIRGASKDPRRFFASAGVLALASALLYLVNHDDEDYKKLPDYVRDTYWVLRFGEKFVYVPKPFEVGAMATIVERATELAVSGDDYKAADFGSNLLGLLNSQLAMNPVPQIVRPAAEAFFNYDMFRRAPIDSLGQMNLLAEDRFTSRTSGAAIVAGKATGMSPQRLEHMLQGYLGWVGVQALNASDHAIRGAGLLPAGPQNDLGRISNLFVVGDFVKDSANVSSKYVTRFYDTQKELDAIYASATAARKSGDTERGLELLKDPRMKVRPIFQRAEKQITGINRQIKAITNHPTLSASEKTAKLDALNKRRDEIAARVDAAARAMK